MSNDAWLRELAQVNREKQEEERNRLDERWDRLSLRDLSPEEEAELRALAETSEEASDTYEAFRPLGSDFQAGVVKAIREQGLVPAAEAPAGKPAKLLPFRRRAAHLAGWGSLAAVAAVLLVTVLRPGPSLPLYTANLQGGARTSRGAEPSPGRQVFVPGTLLTLDVVPTQSVDGPVEARGFVARGMELVPLEPELEVRNGAVRLRGTLGREIRLPPGGSKIWIVVGRPGKLPSRTTLQDELRAGRPRHDDWQAIPQEIQVSR